jgi:hypothetical protein
LLCFQQGNFSFKFGDALFGCLRPIGVLALGCLHLDLLAVHEHGLQHTASAVTAISGVAAMAVSSTIRLTDIDRRMITKAREVAALRDADARRERYGDSDSEMSRAAALGEAQFLLLELAAIIKRLGGGNDS